VIPAMHHRFPETCDNIREYKPGGRDSYCKMH
jgi:hypothetical protein